MMAFLAFLFVILLLGNAANAFELAETCTFGTSPRIPNPKLAECSWYNSEPVCCTKGVTDLIPAYYEFSDKHGCGELSSSCMQQLMLFSCAVACKPWTAKSNKVCYTFGNQVYNSCKWDYMLDKNGKCKQVCKWHSVSAFWSEQIGFELASLGGGSVDCVSSGYKTPFASLIPVVVVVVVVVVVAMSIAPHR